MTIETRRTISYLFLAFFLMMELGSLHVFAHEDGASMEDCDICHVLELNHQTPVVPTNTAEISFENPEIPFQEKIQFWYTSNHGLGYCSYNQFSRPPPVLYSL
ncbi:hypothetical protein [Euzebyella saccharophila]|uniref:Uncharacterized protein n=1 Tax=Euzebyella saccharophila TaxID=679664 RepID=A0ABV8JSZ5_9FLAO|nr:hypothetical protein [Euzebyella saccharophila]MDO1498836.1 hypothetical protein [Winogradskyella maritima]